MGILPKTKHIPETGMPSQIKMLVEGKSKAGKTTFAASWPEALLIECEKGGGSQVSCAMLDLTKGKDPLKGLRMAIEELKTDTTFQTVILDTIDSLAEMVEQEICRDMGIQTIAEAPKGARHGAQWTRYANEITGIVSALISLPKHVIILGHTKPASYDDNGGLKSEEGLDIYGRAARILYARIDNIGHIYVARKGSGTVSILSFKGGADCTRGSRHPALRDKEIILPRENGFEVFKTLFNNN